MTVGLIVAGLWAFGAGVMAYSGRWRSWALRSGFAHNLGFSLLYFGAGFTTMGIFLAFPSGTIPTNLLVSIWVLLCGCGIVGFFWLPSFMLPRWFTNGRNDIREAERAARDLRRSARAMKKARRKP